MIQGTTDSMDGLHRIEGVEIRQVSLKVTGNNSWNTVRAVGYAYQTTDGAWRFTFNIVGSVSACSSETISITGVKFKNISGFSQSVAQSDGRAYAAPNTNQILMNTFSGTVTSWLISGDVELDAKPDASILPGG